MEDVFNDRDFGQMLYGGVSDLEEGVGVSVYNLYKKGFIKTTWSCEGHVGRYVDGYSTNRPGYVIYRPGSMAFEYQPEDEQAGKFIEDLESFIGPLLLVLGLSVLIYSDAWKKLVGEIEKDHFTILSLMIFNLIFGLAIINMHNVWEWSPYVVITVTGWAAFLKGTAYFLLPGEHFKAFVKFVNCKCYYNTAGSISVVLGAWLSYLVYL